METAIESVQNESNKYCLSAQSDGREPLIRSTLNKIKTFYGQKRRRLRFVPVRNTGRKGKIYG